MDHGPRDVREGGIVRPRDAQAGRFSERHGFVPSEVEITVRNDAPHELRGVLVNIAYECGFTPKGLRSLVCRVLRTREDPNNWSDWPNIAEEVSNGGQDRLVWLASGRVW